MSEQWEATDAHAEKAMRVWAGDNWRDRYRAVAGVAVDTDMLAAMRVILTRVIGPEVDRVRADRDCLRARVAELRRAAEDLIAELPHPADDPKLWTTRMADAWGGVRDALRALDAGCTPEAREARTVPRPAPDLDGGDRGTAP